MHRYTQLIRFLQKDVKNKLFLNTAFRILENTSTTMVCVSMRINYVHY